jgi:tight adherence protein C
MILQFIQDNLLLVTAVIASGLLGLIVIILGTVQMKNSKNSVNQRMQEFVVDHDKPQSNPFSHKILPREVSGSFVSRTFVPMFKSIFNFFGKYTPSNAIPKLEHRLAIAGNPMGMHARDFYGLRVVLFFVGLLIAFLINYKTIPIDTLNLILGVLIIVVFMSIPILWLNSAVRTRQDEFRRNLPDALDMLSVCASAGLGFDQSLKKITEYWPTALGAEFKRVIQEMEMGLTRSQALRNLSERLDVNELTSFIAIIVQAESMGMSFADVLHSQAKQMRVLRQYRAKEIANKMPAKMIIPLAAFIFPALIAVILGPIIPTILDLF